MSPVPVSVMIFTLDEEIHLPACLAALGFSDDVIVVDSFSRDRTKAICLEAKARFFEHAFEGFGRQRMWAFEHTQPKHEWILVLDADERVPPELAGEIAEVVRTAPTEVGAFRLRRRFHMWGRWLRHSALYPTWVVRLVRRGRVEYVNRGHAETQVVNGRVDSLHNDLIDENLKSIDEWFDRQNRYSTKEAQFELEQERKRAPLSGLLSADPLERRAALKRVVAALPMRPLAYFLYSYVLRGGFLEGRDGLVFCIMKSEYQRMIVVKKHDMRRQGAT